MHVLFSDFSVYIYIYCSPDLKTRYMSFVVVWTSGRKCKTLDNMNYFLWSSIYLCWPTIRIIACFFRSFHKSGDLSMSPKMHRLASPRSNFPLAVLSVTFSLIRGGGARLVVVLLRKKIRIENKLQINASWTKPSGELRSHERSTFLSKIDFFHTKVLPSLM